MDTPTRIGKYEIQRLIGSGGMGRVYLARDAAIGRLIALKILGDHVANDSEFRARFRREADIIANLTHPNIIPVYDIDSADDRLYIAMQYVEGDDTATSLADHVYFGLERIVRIIEQVASAVDAAHGQGLIHRDIKPANILLTKNDHAYLIDFGIARSVSSDTNLTSSGAVIGTPSYMAPEVFNGGDPEFASDIYALGCTLFYFLTGRPPFAGSSPVQMMSGHLYGAIPRPTVIRSELPIALDHVIARAMAKDPAARYSTALEFAEELRKAIDTTSVIPRPATIFPTSTEVSRIPTISEVGARPKIHRVNVIDVKPKGTGSRPALTPRARARLANLLSIIPAILIVSGTTISLGFISSIAATLVALAIGLVFLCWILGWRGQRIKPGRFPMDESIVALLERAQDGQSQFDQQILNVQSGRSGAK